MRVLLSVLLLYAVLCVLAYLIADRMIFLPPPSSYEDNARGLTFTSENFTLAAVHLPNPAAEYTILYSHGNAEDLGLIAPLLAQTLGRLAGRGNPRMEVTDVQES